MINVRAVAIGCILLMTQSVTAQKLQLKTATGHPMQYYVSLPDGWNASTKWPIVFVMEAAEKEYKLNAERFVSARGKMPFILVAPIHTGNGNQGRRDPDLFPYDTKTWDYIDKVGDCTFNDDGIRQIIQEVRRLYNGEEKIFVTGFEAGAHVVWSLVFNHPEYLKGVAIVAGNYRSRCVDEQAISKDPSRVSLPIRAFTGAKDETWGASSNLFVQWTTARDLAKKNGYTIVDEAIVPDKGHEPMPGEVMNCFHGLLKKN